MPHRAERALAFAMPGWSTFGASSDRPSGSRSTASGSRDDTRTLAAIRELLASRPDTSNASSPSRWSPASFAPCDARSSRPAPPAPSQLPTHPPAQATMPSRITDFDWSTRRQRAVGHAGAGRGHDARAHCALRTTPLRTTAPSPPRESNGRATAASRRSGQGPVRHPEIAVAVPTCFPCRRRLGSASRRHHRRRRPDDLTFRQAFMT